MSTGQAETFYILVAEDHYETRMLLAMYLRHETDFEVVFAADGEEALVAYHEARAAGKPFDLFVLDVDMPVYSGREVVREIRNAEGSPDVPALYITAHSTSSYGDGIEVLVKPYIFEPYDRLARKIREKIAYFRESAASHGATE